jgi:hypothetical protein
MFLPPVLGTLAIILKIQKNYIIYLKCYQSCLFVCQCFLLSYVVSWKDFDPYHPMRWPLFSSSLVYWQQQWNPQICFCYWTILQKPENMQYFCYRLIIIYWIFGLEFHVQQLNSNLSDSSLDCHRIFIHIFSYLLHIFCLQMWRKHIMNYWIRFLQYCSITKTNLRQKYCMFYYYLIAQRQRLHILLLNWAQTLKFCIAFLNMNL